MDRMFYGGMRGARLQEQLPPMSLRHLAVLIPLALAAFAAQARADTVQDEQVWANFTAMGPISGNIVYFAEAQPRFSDSAGGLDQLLLRPAVGLKLSPIVSLYQGYAHVITRRADQADLNEERSFQQLSWIVSRPWGGELSSRTRVEQRWRSDGDDMGWRVREMVRLEGPRVANGKFGALGYVEAFFALNDTDWGARGGFDQLRTFVGAEIPIGGPSTIEVGYLNQAINQTAGRTRVNHVLSFALFFRH